MLCHNCPQLCAETMQRTFAQMDMEWTPRDRCCGEEFHDVIVSTGPRLSKDELTRIEKPIRPVPPLDFRRRDNGHPKRWRP